MPLADHSLVKMVFILNSWGYSDLLRRGQVNIPKVKLNYKITND